MEVLVFALLIAAAVPATLFPFVYGWTARAVWWRVPAGRALIVSSTALALLLDVELAAIVWPALDGLTTVLVVLAVIAIGAWLKLGALLHEWRRGRRSVPPPASHD